MAEGNYQALPLHDGDHFFHETPPDTSRRRGIVKGLYICAWILSVLLVYFYRAPTPKATSYIHNGFENRTFECGHTVSEAIAAGCKFDPTIFSWLPERCEDRELAAELQSNTTWTVHADLEGKIPLSDSEFSTNKTIAYVTNRNHVLHCLYLWKRLHRAVLAGNPFPDPLKYSHTLHCVKIILQALDQPPDEISNIAKINVPFC
ncbi:Major facilitator superfamily transporter [Venturia nashicola]|nr:Major facilitator superfamily transporter [Venturia nashicola]